ISCKQLKKNAIKAENLAQKFKDLDKDSDCTSGEVACVQGEFAKCDNGKFVLTPCNGLDCVVLPLLKKKGTSVTCDTQADADTRIE
ncbi:hypothetical protein C2G38_1910961, partial [Gigaspora rosea]